MKHDRFLALSSDFVSNDCIDEFVDDLIAFSV
jgi:hypothetical protein